MRWYGSIPSNSKTQQPEGLDSTVSDWEVPPERVRFALTFCMVTSVGTALAVDVVFHPSLSTLKGRLVGMFLSMLLFAVTLRIGWRIGEKSWPLRLLGPDEVTRTTDK